MIILRYDILLLFHDYADERDTMSRSSPIFPSLSHGKAGAALFQQSRWRACLRPPILLRYY